MVEVAKLDSDDTGLRHDIVVTALAVIEEEQLEVLDFSDDDIATFVLEWQNLAGEDTRNVRKLLRSSVVEDLTVLEWIFKGYSMERLHALCEFSRYCDWLSPLEIMRHYGSDLLRLFMTLQGKTPSWSIGIPYHLVLQTGFTELYKRHREYAIKEWLRNHWDEAVKLFDESIGTLDSFPEMQGIEYSHIYTQYRKIKSAKTRQWMKENPGSVKDVEDRNRIV